MQRFTKWVVVLLVVGLLPIGAGNHFIIRTSDSTSAIGRPSPVFA